MEKKGKVGRSTRAVSVNGIVYACAQDAARTYGVHYLTVVKRCNNTYNWRFKQWFYVDKQPNQGVST